MAFLISVGWAISRQGRKKRLAWLQIFEYGRWTLAVIVAALHCRPMRSSLQGLAIAFKYADRCRWGRSHLPCFARSRGRFYRLDVDDQRNVFSDRLRMVNHPWGRAQGWLRCPLSCCFPSASPSAACSGAMPSWLPRSLCLFPRQHFCVLSGRQHVCRGLPELRRFVRSLRICPQHSGSIDLEPGLCHRWQSLR